MNKDLTISIIVPVFNAENTIDELNIQLHHVLSRYSTFEIIYVDDASQDSSWEKLNVIKQNNNKSVKIIKLARNYGQHNATLCGLKHSKGEINITIDDDLEHPPVFIHTLIESYTTFQSDLTYADPTNKKQNILKKIGRFIYKKIAKISADGGRGSSYRLISKYLKEKLLSHHSSFVFIDEFCTWHTDDIKFIPTKFNSSPKNKSSYKLSDLIYVTLNLVMISSAWPLRMVTFVGTTLMLFNFGLGLYYIIRKVFLSIPIPGYTSLMVSILFSTGLILLALGVIAEYISKILQQNYNKPTFQEKEIL